MHTEMLIYFNMINRSGVAPHVQMLNEELERRRKANPRYSLRAFAKYLDLHPSTLSRILANKQDLSLSACVIVLKKLKLEPDQVRTFISSVAEDKKNRALQTLSVAFNIEGEEDT